VAEETTIFRGMVIRQWCFFSGCMTTLAELLRLFFSHGHEPLVILVMGQQGCGLARCIEKKKQESGTPRDKKDIVENMFLFGGHIV
jgi:hypothetical protein